jgi:serine/threonine protein kinase
MKTNKMTSIEEIVVNALERSESERPQYVYDACDGNTMLINEVFSFLDASKGNKVQDFFDNGLPEIQMSVAKANSDSGEFDDKQKFEQEKAEEKLQWEGKIIGKDNRYTIERLFRAGLMATLFFGMDKKLGSRVVIKIPRKSAYIKSENDDRSSANDKANIRNNFRREFDALKTLNQCPNVVNVLDFDDLPDSRPFMVQEFIDGDTALGLVEKNPSGIDRKQAADIIKQASYGLESAHKEKILHRDIKADNIMISGLVAKLIDFNAADVKFPFSPMSTVFKDQTWGAPYYCSPEQLRNMMAVGENQQTITLTPASDVYALAVTAYQLLTGRLPFSDNLADLISQKNNDSFTPPSTKTSAEIDELLKQAMSRNPLDRPQSAKEFGEAFAKAVENIGVAATIKDPPPPPPIVVYNKGNKLKWLVAAAVLSLLLLAGSYGIWSVMSNENSPKTNSEQTKTNDEKPPTKQTDAPLAFTYWLDLYRVNENGKPSSKPIQASGQAVFTTGDQFNLNFVCPRDGYLYLLNDGKNADGIKSINFLDKFTIKGNVPIAVPPDDTYSFDKNSNGLQEFWLVFSALPIEKFEQYKDEMQKTNKYYIELTEDKAEEVRNFLNQQKPSDLTTNDDKANAKTIVKSSGEIIAYKAELRHQ